MCLTWYKCDLFNAPGFIVSPVGKRERRGIKRRREGEKKGIEKEWKEARKEEGIRKDGRNDKKKEF